LQRQKCEKEGSDETYVLNRV